MGAHTNAKTMPDPVRLCARAGQRLMFGAVPVVPLLHAGVGSAAASACYRFDNTRIATHFYTIAAGERDAVTAIPTGRFATADLGFMA